MIFSPTITERILNGGHAEAYNKVLQDFIWRNGYELIHNEPTKDNICSVSVRIKETKTEVFTFDFPQGDPWGWRKEVLTMLLYKGLETFTKPTPISIVGKK